MRPSIHRIRILLAVTLALIALAAFHVMKARRHQSMAIQEGLIALTNDNPGHALQIVQGILREQPDQPDALRLQARAQMALGRIESCRTTLQRLIDRHPSDVEARHLLINWTFRAMADLMARKDFRTPDCQARFDQVLKLGLAQIEQSGEDGDLLHARYDLADVQRCQLVENIPADAVRRRLEHAETSLQNVVARHEALPAARYLLALTCFHSGKFQQAEALLDSLDRQQPGTPQVKALYVKVLFRQRKPRQVLAQLPQALRLNPRDPELLAIAMQALQATGDRAGVSALVRQLEHLPNPTAAHRLALADGYLYRQDPSDLERFRTILRGLPPGLLGHGPVQLLRARYALVCGRYDLAYELLRPLLDADPGNCQVRFLYAQALAGLYRPDEALAQVRQLSDLERYAPAFLAQLERSAGHTAESRRIAERAIEAGATDPRLHLILAEAYQRPNASRLIEFHLQEYIRHRPDDPVGYSQLCQLFLQDHRTDDGLNAVRSLETLDQPLSYLSESRLLQAAGRNDEALALLQSRGTAVAKRSENLALVFADAAASIYLRQGDLPRAKAAYEPLFAIASLADQARLHQIDLAPSVAALDAFAGRVKTDQPLLLYELLLRYARLGACDRALALLDKWIHLRPNQTVLLDWKAQLLIRAGQPASAAAEFRRAIELDPTNLRLRHDLARTCLLNRDLAGAQTALQEMGRLDPAAERHAAADQARLYAATGRNDQAEKLLATLSSPDLSPDPQVLLAVGETYAALGRKDPATRALAGIPEAFYPCIRQAARAGQALELQYPLPPNAEAPRGQFPDFAP